MTKKPSYRFADYTEPWADKKLGELVERVTRKNKNLESDLPLTISAQYGLIDQETFFNKTTLDFIFFLSLIKRLLVKTSVDITY